MSTSLRAGVGALFATVFAAASLALAGPTIATAGTVEPAGPVQVNFVPITSPFTADSLQVGVGVVQACDSNITATDVVITKDSLPVPAIFLLAGVAPNGFTMSVPASVAGPPGSTNMLTVAITCNVSSSPLTQTGEFYWSQINVTKTVVGSGPAGATYPILVSCIRPVAASVGPASVDPATISAPVDIPLALADGATGSVLTMTPGGSCSISETDTLGATSSLISASVITIVPGTTYAVDVTNTFAETPRFTG